MAPAPGSLVPSMAFATGMQARLPLGPLARGSLTTPQASLDAADWSVAPRPASTPGSRPTPGAALPGTLASPRTGLTPAGCRELVARLRRGTPPFGGPRRPSCWTHILSESRSQSASRGHGVWQIPYRRYVALEAIDGPTTEVTTDELHGPSFCKTKAGYQGESRILDSAGGRLRRSGRVRISSYFHIL